MQAQVQNMPYYPNGSKLLNNCWISQKTGYAGLSVLHLLPRLNSWLIVGLQPDQLSSIGINHFGRCSFELTQLVPLPYSRSRSTCHSLRLHNFSVNNSRCYELDSGTICLQNTFLSPMILKATINRHLIPVGSF